MRGWSANWFRAVDHEATVGGGGIAHREKEGPLRSRKTRRTVDWKDLL